MEITALGVSVLGGTPLPRPARERFPSAGTDDRKRPPLRWLYRVISNELPSSFRCVQVRAWIAKISVNENIQIRYTQR